VSCSGISLGLEMSPEPRQGGIAMSQLDGVRVLTAATPNHPQIAAQRWHYMPTLPRNANCARWVDVVVSTPMDAATEPTLKATIGANIRLARQRAGISQRKLAKLIGMEPNDLSRYENGHVRPRDDRIGLICELTGAPSLGWFYDPHDDVER